MSTATLERETVAEVMSGVGAPDLDCKNGLRLTVSRAALLPALQAAAKTCAGKTTLAILNGVLLRVTAGELRVLATDLEMSLEMRMPVTADDGVACVDSKRAAQVVAAIPGEDVYLSSDASELTFRSGASEFRLPLLAAHDHPPLPEVTRGTPMRLTSISFLETVRQAAFGASDDGTRPILTGVLLRVRGGNLTAVSTDTHRVPVKVLSVECEGDWDVIIPAERLEQAAKLASEGDEVTLQADENLVKIEGPGWTFISRLIAGQFPKYERIIPTSHSGRVLFNREALIACLRRVKLLNATVEEAGKKSHCARVLFNITGLECEIHTRGDDGVAREVLELEELSPEPMDFAINPNYLLDALQAWSSEQVALERQADPFCPQLWRPVGDESVLCIICPMQVK